MPFQPPDEPSLSALLSPELADIYFSAFHEVMAHDGKSGKQAVVDLANALHLKFCNAVLFLDEGLISLLDDELTYIRSIVLERLGGPAAFLRALNAEMQYPDRYLYSSALTFNLDDLPAPVILFFEESIGSDILARLKEREIHPLPLTGAQLVVEESMKLMNLLAAMVRKRSASLMDSMAVAEKWAFICSATHAFYLTEFKKQAEDDLSGETRRKAGKTLSQVLRRLDRMAKHLVGTEPAKYTVADDVPDLPNAGRIRLDLLTRAIVKNLPDEFRDFSTSKTIENEIGTCIIDFKGEPPKGKPIQYGAVLNYLHTLYGENPTPETIMAFIFERPLSHLRKRFSK